jgi:hypothetical protein
LYDTVKIHNILMDTVKSEFCPVSLQNRVYLLKTHCLHYFIRFLYLQRDEVGEITFLPSSSTFVWPLILAETHRLSDQPLAPAASSAAR